VLPAWQRYDRISAISCVTLGPGAEQPELYFELLPADLNVQAEDIVAFLRQLRRELPGPWTVVWDRHNIHSHSRLAKECLAGEPEVVLEDLPAYAPALNPDELVWAWLKNGRLATLAPADVAELRDHLLRGDGVGRLRWRVAGGVLQPRQLGISTVAHWLSSRWAQ
jgi:hypothetical protein